MKIDPSRFAVGDEWAYRKSDDAPSERVRILAVEPKKNSARLEIRFLDDPDERVEKIPCRGCGCRGTRSGPSTR
jgi:hypothetical protein